MPGPHFRSPRCGIKDGAVSGKARRFWPRHFAQITVKFRRAKAPRARAATDSTPFGRSKPERPRLLHVRKLLHLLEHVRRHRSVHLHQRNGVATWRVAAHVEGGNVDADVTQEAGEA